MKRISAAEVIDKLRVLLSSGAAAALFSGNQSNVSRPTILRMEQRPPRVNCRALYIQRFGGVRFFERAQNAPRISEQYQSTPNSLQFRSAFTAAKVFSLATGVQVCADAKGPASNPGSGSDTLTTARQVYIPWISSEYQIVRVRSNSWQSLSKLFLCSFPRNVPVLIEPCTKAVFTSAKPFYAATKAPNATWRCLFFAKYS